MKAREKASYRILVVDDESAVRDSIRMVLEFLGHTAETADSGATALSLFKSGRFDLVITDNFMHGMKGDQLAATIKQQQPGLPVIMATAFPDKLDANNMLEGIVDCLVIKPFAIADLSNAIEKVMR
jgi:two-component system cell cycle response regulator CpdR